MSELQFISILTRNNGSRLLVDDRRCCGWLEWKCKYNALKLFSIIIIIVNQSVRKEEQKHQLTRNRR